MFKINPVLCKIWPKQGFFLYYYSNGFIFPRQKAYLRLIYLNSPAFLR